VACFLGNKGAEASAGATLPGIGINFRICKSATHELIQSNRIGLF
jgi:hypothetical protein